MKRLFFHYNSTPLLPLLLQKEGERGDEFIFPNKPIRLSGVLSGLVLCALLFAAHGNAQPTGSLSGRVTDSQTGDPLAGANVVLVETTQGTTTNQEGEFTFEGIPSGRRHIRVSFVGYAPRVFEAEVVADRSTAVHCPLAPSPIITQPITVSATRGHERETPAAFATLERQEIRDRYTTQDIPVLLSELPSTTFYSEAGNGIGYTYLNIRGFDARRIAVMINGIPQNDPEDHNVYWLDAPDIAGSVEDVQVQRGAGSAFYGSPAIGGSVNLVTSYFGQERVLELSAGMGSFNTRKYAASFSSGLIDGKYAFHGRLSKILSSGYRDRSWVDFNSYFLGMARYDEHMTTQVNFYGGPVSDHLAYYGIPKSDVKNRDLRRANPIVREEEIENFSQPHYELFHEWRLNPAVTLNNTLFFIFGDGFFDYDGSWAPYSYFRITPQNGFPVTGGPDTLYFSTALIRAQVTNRQFGWLPRLTWNHGAGTLIVGAELRRHRSDHWGRLQRADQIPVPVPEDYRYYQYKGAKEIASVYVHELYALRPDLQLMADVQYVYNKYRLYDEKFVGTDFSVPYHFVNPRAGINYNFTERWNGYLSVAYTSREPRLKNLYDAAEASTPASWGAVVPQFAQSPDGRFDFDAPLVTPEHLLDIELGANYATQRGGGSLNLYWMEFTNEIVKSGQVDRFGQPITGNAARTRHVGIEGSVKVEVLPGLELGANATLSRNRFVSHSDYSTGAAVSLNENPIAGFPDVLGNFRLTYRVEDFTLSWSGRYVGKQYTDNFKDEENTVDPFFVSDAWCGYTFRNVADGLDIDAKVQVNNVFDTLYASYGEGASFFVGAERSLFLNLAIRL